MADPDSVHDAIVLKGPQVLRRGVPYVLQAARWQLASRRRTEGRRDGDLVTTDPSSLPAQPALWDPFERAARSESLHTVALALARLKEEEVIAVWDHFAGDSDAEILDKWLRLGVGSSGASQATVRKVRQRALARIKQQILRVSRRAAAGHRR